MIVSSSNSKNTESEGKPSTAKSFKMMSFFQKFNIYYYWNRIITIMESMQQYLIHQQNEHGYSLNTESNTFTNLIVTISVLLICIVRQLINLVYVFIPIYQMIIHIVQFIFNQVLAIKTMSSNYMRMKKILITLAQIKVLYEINLFIYYILLKPIWIFCYQIINHVFNVMF